MGFNCSGVQGMQGRGEGTGVRTISVELEGGTLMMVGYGTS